MLAPPGRPKSSAAALASMFCSTLGDRKVPLGIYPLSGVYDDIKEMIKSEANMVGRQCDLQDGIAWKRLEWKPVQRERVG